tara:strand:+ start:156 stop:740 length:585 start_codon:yes stop_codon:yes gene_type:complete
VKEKKMKIKTILASVILCCSFQTVKGQTNNIYVEGLGVGLLGSINYERMIIPDKLFARASYGGFSISSTSLEDVYDDYGYYIGTVDSEVELSINPLCLGAHYMFGKKWKAEIGGGISYWMMSLDASAENATQELGGISISEDGGYLMFYTSLGFRYQNPEGGLTFKLGVSPSILRYEGESASLPMPHIGVGYSF